MIVKVILEKSKVAESILEGVKEVKFLLFNLLLINLYISNFLGKMHMYRKRER